MRLEIAGFISIILFFLEMIITIFYGVFFFAGDYSLRENKSFLGDLKQSLESKESYSSFYMSEFEKAFPHIDEEKGLVGNNWFSKTLDFCFILVGILNITSTTNFNPNSTEVRYMKRCPILIIFVLILLIISFINTFFYVDQVYMPEKDIYIFSSGYNSTIKKRLATIKLAKTVYIGCNLCLFFVEFIHFIFIFTIYSNAKDEENEFLINSSNQAKKAQGVAPINEL